MDVGEGESDPGQQAQWRSLPVKSLRGRNLLPSMIATVNPTMARATLCCQSTVLR